MAAGISLIVPLPCGPMLLLDRIARNDYSQQF